MAHAPQRTPPDPGADGTPPDEVSPTRRFALAVDRVPGVAAVEPLQRYTRWAWLVSLLLHLLLLLALREGMRPRPLEGRDGTPIRVELIAPPAQAPPPPQVDVPVHPAPVTVARPLPAQAVAALRATPHPPAAPAIPPEAASNATPATAPVDGPALRFYNPDGSANIPKDLLAQMQRAQPIPGYIPKEFLVPDFMQHKNPLHYTATDFEPTWVPLNENLLAEFVRRNLTREVIFKTPWGGTVRCTFILVMGACAGVPPPAWKKPDKVIPMPAPEWQ